MTIRIDHLVVASGFAVVGAVAACTPGGLLQDCANVPTFANVKAFEQCTACHSSQLAPADRHLAPGNINYDTYEAAKKDAAEAAEEVEKGSMPPESEEPLSEEDAADLIKWARCGTPQ